MIASTTTSVRAMAIAIVANVCAMLAGRGRLVIVKLPTKRASPLVFSVRFHNKFKTTQLWQVVRLIHLPTKCLIFAERRIREGSSWSHFKKHSLGYT